MRGSRTSSRNPSQTLNTREVCGHTYPSQELTNTPLRSEVSVGAGNGHNVLPTISIDDVDKPAEEEVEHSAPVPPTPGDYPSRPAPAIPDWYKIGWRAAANIDAPPEEGEEKDKSILGLFLSDQFYGAWYHNAALIVFVCLTLVLPYFA